MKGMAMARVRVLIADDHALFREGVRMILEGTGEVEVVAEASNGEEALKKVEELRPDIAILDIAMPKMNGLQAAKEIGRRMPETKVLVLTMHATDEHFFEALQAGASGYILKEGASADLRAAIQAIQRGQVFIYPSLTRRLVEDYLSRADGEEHSSYASLTKREQEILQLIAQGHTNQEIADKLVLSVSTVQTHRGHIMEKLNLHSRAQLLQYAVRLGLLRQTT